MDASNRIPETVVCWIGAIVLWLGLAFSLAWYYTFTYYGAVGWPMPFIEACGALVLYYFSVLNVDTEIQAAHWLVVFPFAGVLWAAALQWTARCFGHDRPPFSRLLILLALASAPLALPGPWMAYLGGHTADGFAWDRMTDVALRRGNISPWAWLSPMYFTLGLFALVLEVYLYHRAFRIPAKAQALHYLSSAIVFVVSCCIIGVLASWPLRYWFEW